MKILAFDCAGASCSAAVIEDGTVLARRLEAMDRGQAEVMIPMIASVLAEAHLTPMALDLIAVTTGPGGFTGVRIGLAAARGLALATGVPAIGVDCFAAVAAATIVPPGRTLVVALESKRAELYLRISAPDIGPPLLVAPDSWNAWVPSGPVLLAGDGAARLAAALAGRDLVVAAGTGLVDAADVARVAASLWQAGTRPAPAPLYLRPPDTTPAAPRPGIVPAQPL